MSNPRDVQRAKRDKLFLKGPIYFEWIRQNISDPTARLLLVARAFMDMEEKNLEKLEMELVLMLLFLVLKILFQM